MRRAIACGALSLLLAACSLTSTRDWPQSLPSRSHFQQLYRADPVNQQYQTQQEYLGWIVDFYQGSLLYPTGWQDVELAVLSAIPPEDQQRVAALCRQLGIAIAGEWAKDNSVRLIDNRLLSLWGSILQLAPGEHQLSQAIAVIGSDINAILAGQLDPVTVSDSRYAERLPFELFGDF